MVMNNKKRTCFYLTENTIKLINNVRIMSNITKGSLVEKAVTEFVQNKTALELQKLGEKHD